MPNNEKLIIEKSNKNRLEVLSKYLTLFDPDELVISRNLYKTEREIITQRTISFKNFFENLLDQEHCHQITSSDIINNLFSETNDPLKETN